MSALITRGHFCILTALLFVSSFSSNEIDNACLFLPSSISYLNKHKFFSSWKKSISWDI